jgi:hypothetical protein
MNLPLDPTQDDASPLELLRHLPSQAARRRVFQAAGIHLDPDDGRFADKLDELSQIELQQAASQLRFAGDPTVYYYQINGLQQLSFDGATGRVDDVSRPGVYGPEVQTAIRDHGRIYVVCNVPDTGSQTQLMISEESRSTTVAVFKPGTQLLAVRASDDNTADATIHAVLSYLGLDNATRVSFLDIGFRGRFEDACVDGYSTLRLKNTNPRDTSREIEVRSKDPEAGNLADVRSDAIVEDLIERDDTELNAATGLITVPTDVRALEHGEPLHPRVTIGFPDGWVAFDLFVPEQILIEFDDIVRDSL